MSDGTHTEHEDHPWSVEIPDHPPRADSPEYVQSRKTMNRIARETTGLLYGEPPWQDHHGAGLWLKDDQGWFLVRNLAGIEWSAQFCADPAKVDQVRQNAQRLYAHFPGVAEELGVQELLDTPITDAAGVGRWTDSVCNASVPLSAEAHSGVLPAGGGVHHYPSPITEIAFIKQDDFQLWVTDEEGHPAAVAPVAPAGSGDGRVHVLWANPGSELHARHHEAAKAGKALVLDAGNSLAVQAFAAQPPAGGTEAP